MPLLLIALWWVPLLCEISVALALCNQHNTDPYITPNANLIVSLCYVCWRKGLVAYRKEKENLYAIWFWACGPSPRHHRVPKKVQSIDKKKGTEQFTVSLYEKKNDQKKISMPSIYCRMLSVT